MFTLFYSKTDPKSYQTNGGSHLIYYSTAGQYVFDKFHFIPYKCLNIPIDYNTISDDSFIITATSINSNAEKIIYWLDQYPNFHIYKYRNIKNDLQDFVLWITLLL